MEVIYITLVCDAETMFSLQQTLGDSCEVSGKNGQCSLVSSWCYFLIGLPERMQLFSLL